MSIGLYDPIKGPLVTQPKPPDFAQALETLLRHIENGSLLWEIQQAARAVRTAEVSTLFLPLPTAKETKP